MGCEYQMGTFLLLADVNLKVTNARENSNTLLLNVDLFSIFQH